MSFIPPTPEQIKAFLEAERQHQAALAQLAAQPKPQPKPQDRTDLVILAVILCVLLPIALVGLLSLAITLLH